MNFFHKYVLKFFLLPALLAGPALQSQNSDSLRKLLYTRLPDSTRVNVLCKLAGIISDSAEFYGEKALELARNKGVMIGEARARVLLGKHNYFAGKFSASLEHCAKAFQIARSLGENRLAGVASLYIGFNHFGNAPKTAMEYYRNCIYYAKLSRDERLLAYAYSAMGNLYEKLYDGKSALGFYLLSLKIRERSGRSDEIISSMIETARAYDRLKLYDHSAQLVEKATLMAEKTNDDFQNLIYLYQMAGYDYCDRLQDYKKAQIYFFKAYNLAVTHNALTGNNINTLKPIADCYFNLRNFELASQYYKQYYDLFSEEQKKTDKKLFESQAKLQRETETQQFLMKDARISKQQMQIAKEKNVMYLLFGGLILLVILSIFLFRTNRQKQKAAAELERKVNERTSELKTANEQLQQEMLANDVAQLKLAESESKLKEINTELESFIYRASHDMKGPLASSLGLVNLALEGSPEEKTEYLQLISNALGRLDNILVDLQEITLIRQGQLKFKEYDLVNGIRTLFSSHSQYDNFQKIKLTVNDAIVSRFFTDEILMNSILRNMTENAVKYSKRLNGSFVTFDLFEHEHEFEIEVTDNGIGIAPEFQHQIFDVFVRANNVTKGSGLGLYIVKNAVNKLGGKVELVSSALKEGSKFRITLPKQSPS